MKVIKGRVERLGYRYAEAAQAIGCCPEHIANLVKRGELRSAAIGRCRVISRGRTAKTAGADGATIGLGRAYVGTF